jgi:hypothetical protein
VVLELWLTTRTNQADLMFSSERAAHAEPAPTCAGLLQPHQLCLDGEAPGLCYIQGCSLLTGHAPQEEKRIIL